MGKLNKDNFRDLFGTWWSRIEGFYDKGGFEPIYEFLKFEGSRGKMLAPLSSNTFRCFQETSVENIKVVMMGICPYHSFTYNNLPIADGLLMSCSITGKLQPSLEKYYDAVEKEVYQGLNLHIIKNPDLTFLANDGCLLFNAALTTERGKAGNHLPIWEPFIDYFFGEVLSGINVPIILLGKETAKYKKYISPFTWIFEVEHPAASAYSGSDWNTQGLFQRVNKVLKDTNNETLKWAQTDE